MAPLEHYYPDAASFLRAHPHRPATLCFTNGCFDLLHPGHVQYLEDVRALGDFLVVGLNSDASVRRLKGPGRPLQDERARALILCGLRSVDAVVRFGEDTPLELITALQPDLLAKGGRLHPRDGGRPGGGGGPGRAGRASPVPARAQHYRHRRPNPVRPGRRLRDYLKVLIRIARGVRAASCSVQLTSRRIRWGTSSASPGSTSLLDTQRSTIRPSALSRRTWRVSALRV